MWKQLQPPVDTYSLNLLPQCSDVVDIYGLFQFYISPTHNLKDLKVQKINYKVLTFSKNQTIVLLTTTN